MEQQGRSAAGAQAGSGRAARRARGAGPRSPKTLIFVVCSLLLQVSPVSPRVISPDIVKQLAGPQMWRDSHREKQCQPGFYLSGESGSCISCIDGKEYTSHQNQLPSCKLCAVCKSDEEEVAPCTTIQNRKCQCKTGTFREENSPEFCKNCSSRCSEGMMEIQACTPRNDRICVSREAGSAQSGTVPVVLSVCVLVLLLGLIILAWWYRKRLSGVLAVFMNTVCSRFICRQSEPGASDNAYNERQSLRESRSVEVSEQEQEGQELAERAGDSNQAPVEAAPAGATGQAPEEVALLLASARADTLQTKRRQLVPATGVDPTESLRLCFDHFSNIIPITCWDRLLRRMGLSDNDIHVARARAGDPHSALYEMLMTWLNRTGRKASINTLLDALDDVGERAAWEKIENYLVGSGNFIYKDDGADSAFPYPKMTQRQPFPANKEEKISFLGF
ncbi:tumor necrosis factor receptor superfamily member 10B-like [Erinaceus europaeus]|uniref:Tumor necrosis factor receptor superfamily member 10B-like n=1 Tax=Erinaceus europaeus TaxID=9365 RepID=A0ABM3WE23_ERIEU|nr:tumor necrosis factor receptor superfamily member 10B-like [Erinaceus europaeus]